MLDIALEARRQSEGMFRNHGTQTSPGHRSSNVSSNVHHGSSPSPSPGVRNAAGTPGGGSSGPPSSNNSIGTPNSLPPPPRPNRTNNGAPTPDHHHGLQSRNPSSGYINKTTGSIYVQGRKLQTRLTPLKSSSHFMNRIWDKYNRVNLSADDRLSFDSKAGGYALMKHNKLRVLTQVAQDDEVLQKNFNLQYQLRALKKHCDEYDIGDVMEIIVPVDLRRSPQTRSERFNLFDDYMTLDPDVVAQSNAYYNSYCIDPFINENLVLTYNMVRANTDDTLFHKCLEVYDRYHPQQHGGPLLLSLILKKINSATEQQLDYLKLKAHTLRISSLEGENVDTAVSLLDAALNTFISASTTTLNRKPIEWEKDLISIFQTTSIPSFNQVFYKIQSDVRQAADMSGGIPQWPTHESLTRLASATYGRLKLSGDWDLPGKKHHHALLQATHSNPNSNSRPSYQRKCWNCGSPDHTLNDCKLPHDKPRIERSREEFNKSRGFRNNKSNFKPRGKTNYSNNKKAYLGDVSSGEIVIEGKAYALQAKSDKTKKSRAKKKNNTSEPASQGEARPSERGYYVRDIQGAVSSIL